MQGGAVEKLDEDQPEMHMLRLMCGPFGQIQGLNFSKMPPAEVEETFRRGLVHPKFSTMLCCMQPERGRSFMFEHPSTATSWRIDMVTELLKLLGLMIVDFDFCNSGMTNANALGTRLVKKRTKIIINSLKLAKGFAKSQRNGCHRRVQITNFRVGLCQVCHTAFCDEVHMAMEEEINNKHHSEECVPIAKLLMMMEKMPRDNPSPIPSGMGDDSPQKHPHKDSEENLHIYHGRQLLDDVHGRPFDKERGLNVRQLKTELFNNMKIYTKVDKSIAKLLDANVIATKWVDTSKGDAYNLDYRARFVGREVKIDQRLELFAATFAFESLRMIFAICASHGQELYRITSSDVKRAYSPC